ncbi:hypothetical protein M011DRAFT_459479 [Sporormia fimetaria CBS 119925]|uniref:Hypersensitive response inducing protein 1 n=1 Tax=Sporormia fimetaria CBS 119925 TaxID=1340428 RepID=A0A6A6V8X0_9PLEO|nr:hypothetical protein M011DRAFT_459479 [Sporormia fimetaria CBS 119925]
MLTSTLLLLLPTLALTSPLHTRQSSPCVPTSYTISNYQYTTSASTGARILFNFNSAFSNPSIITDPASTGATCDASDPSGSIPFSNECSTGRRNLMFDLRGPQERAEFQIIHSWRCNGQEWLSSTPHKINPLDCTTDAEGKTTCSSGPNSFAPQNVRRICNTPTCPE